jgi:ribA/ribD-fused uncharacterized protein
MAIDNFDGEYRFLSNFYYPSVVKDDMGLEYTSVEAAYQAAKTLDYAKREPFTCMSPNQAKKVGRTLQPLRPDWEEVKIEVMRGFLKQKFSDPELKQKLLDTGSRELIEGNWWGDRFWGVCKGKGKNWLGKLLMELRNELRLTKSS